MPVDRAEDRLHHVRHVSDICKAHEIQWLRCGTTHDAAIDKSAPDNDQPSKSGHGTTVDGKQQWEPNNEILVPVFTKSLLLFELYRMLI